jgi:hypothetical protein
MLGVPVRPGTAPKDWGRGGWFTGNGDTDCTLSAEQTAAGSKAAVSSSTWTSDSDGGLIAGPTTSELVGMEDGWAERPGAEDRNSGLAERRPRTRVS